MRKSCWKDSVCGLVDLRGLLTRGLSIRDYFYRICVKITTTSTGNQCYFLWWVRNIERFWRSVHNTEHLFILLTKRINTVQSLKRSKLISATFGWVPSGLQYFVSKLKRKCKGRNREAKVINKPSSGWKWDKHKRKGTNSPKWWWN